MDSQGHFIVIDGTDGSGKATQSRLLIEAIKKSGQLVELISFPQYGTKSAGPVEELLSGKYGSANELGPKAASILFAVDRFDASSKIKAWLANGRIVIADRYVGSNMGHQGSKIEDPVERAKFFDWDMELEHELFGIPRPTINVILHVPAATAQKLAQDNVSKHGLKQDIYEQDLQHLMRAETAYMDLTKRFNTFRLVECMEHGTLLSPERIHERVWSIVQPHLNPTP